jgi:hypothetical protein
MRILQQNLKHYRHTLQTHTTDTHYRHALQTHTTDTHYRHALQTHTTDTHYRHTLQTHSSSFLTQQTYPCSNFVAISSLVLELLKKCRVRYRVGHTVLISLFSFPTYILLYTLVFLGFSVLWSLFRYFFQAISSSAGISHTIAATIVTFTFHHYERTTYKFMPKLTQDIILVFLQLYTSVFFPYNSVTYIFLSAFCCVFFTD